MNMVLLEEKTEFGRHFLKKKSKIRIPFFRSYLRHRWSDLDGTNAIVFIASMRFFNVER
jgi:hypothetical protein